MAVDLRGRRLRGGAYELQERLAEGGMAAVYTAHHRSLDTTVAVKVLSPELASDPSFLERFQTEATTIAQTAFHHPNIVVVHDHDVEDGHAYIVMRYVPGGTLRQRVAQMAGPMDLRSAARLTAQVAAALQHAHDQGRVHLDVKPANVLMGNADWPLLSDFGIMEMLGDTHRDGRRVAGTPAYMSPEQWQGLPLDGRSDQYSLALVFYELVTGRLPFLGETSAELKAQHVGEAPPRPRELNPGIPGPVEAVMLRALAKDPEDRFPTIGGFAAALVEAVERVRGMQLETKDALVSVAPALVALAVLSLVGALLATLPSRSLPIVGGLTLEWPVRLIVALFQVGLLLGIRWQVIGLASRMVASAVDAVDRFTRRHVRIGTDPEGPLRVAAWRSSAIGSVESVVNILYLFAVFLLIAPTLFKLVALAVDPDFAATLATGAAGLLLLVVAAIVLQIRRASGSVVAVCVLAVSWNLVNAMPLAEIGVLGPISLQWLARLAVGVPVLAACLAVRKRIDRAIQEQAVPLLDEQIVALQLVRGTEPGADRRRAMVAAADGLTNLVYLIVGYGLVGVPLRWVLAAIIGNIQAVLAVSLVVILAVALQLLRLRQVGLAPAALGLLLGAPLCLSLPLFEIGAFGAPLRWAGQLLIGALVLAVLLRARDRVRDTARRVVGPAADRHLGGLLPSGSEAQEQARRQTLDDASDTLVTLAYLAVGCLAIVGPIANGLAGSPDLGWIVGVLYAACLAAAGYVLYDFLSRFLPAVRPNAVDETGAAEPAAAGETGETGAIGEAVAASAAAPGA